MSLCNCFTSSTFSSGPSIKDITLGCLNSSSYSIQSDSFIQRGSCERKITFKHGLYDVSLIEKRFPWIKVTCYLLEKSPNENLIVLHIKNTSIQAMSKKHKLIYCQNERSDLGISFPFLVDFSTQTKLDIISFDYSGYGGSKGKSSIDKMLEDIRQVVNFTVASLACPINELILFGDSIGTICPLYISGLKGYSHIKGMILLSPLFTGKETPKVPATCYSEIACPVLIIHGKKDERIAPEQSAILIKKIQLSCLWAPKNGTHFDIPSAYRKKFFFKIIDFLNVLAPNTRTTSNFYDDQFSINFSQKVNQRKVQLINSYIKNGTNKEINIEGNGDKNEGKSIDNYVIQTNTPGDISKKATLQNNLSPLNQRNIMYTSSNERPESVGSFDLFND